MAIAMMLFTLWPAVHIGLVKWAGLSSWKLAGWGMYATPRVRDHGMEIYGRRANDSAFTRWTDTTGPMRRTADKLLARYFWLGTLTRPDSLVESVFAARPDWQQVRITLFEPMMIPATGMIERREVDYEYARGGGLQQIVVGTPSP